MEVIHKNACADWLATCTRQRYHNSLSQTITFSQKLEYTREDLLYDAEFHGTAVSELGSEAIFENSHANVSSELLQ